MVTIVNINSTTDKDNIVKGVYENVDTGYGSIKDTFDQAKNKTVVLNTLMLKSI